MKPTKKIVVLPIGDWVRDLKGSQFGQSCDVNDSTSNLSDTSSSFIFELNEKRINILNILNAATKEWLWWVIQSRRVSHKVSLKFPF